MDREFSAYSEFVFDFDGVILNSNKIKTEAFRQVASRHFGKLRVEQLVDFHLENPGLSRYQKFEFLLGLQKRTGVSRERLLSEYSEHVIEKLLTCEGAKNLEALRKKYSNQSWTIVSGTDHRELQIILKLRGIADLFDGGAYGSPSIKSDIIRSLSFSNRSEEVVLFGDAISDLELARTFSFDFVFVSDWSEPSSKFSNSELFNCRSVSRIDALL